MLSPHFSSRQVFSEIKPELLGTGPCQGSDTAAQTELRKGQSRFQRLQLPRIKLNKRSQPNSGRLADVKVILRLGAKRYPKAAQRGSTRFLRSAKPLLNCIFIQGRHIDSLLDHPTKVGFMSKLQTRSHSFRTLDRKESSIRLRH